MQNNIFLGLFVGHKIVTLKEVDSTNSFLKHSLSNSAPLAEGTVIMAEKQLAGRGQTGNAWHSQEGKNLIFSVLLKPCFLEINKQFELNMAMSLALNDVLTNYFSSMAKIKWPNDSYIGNQKIAGMLIENIVQGTKIKHAIVGVGLNINQSEFPQSLPNASSFKKILQNDYDLRAILVEICAAIEARYLQLRAGKFNQLHGEYLDKLYQFDKVHTYKFDGLVQNGKILGISKEGFLQLETDSGHREFSIKEIEFLSP